MQQHGDEHCLGRFHSHVISPLMAHLVESFLLVLGPELLEFTRGFVYCFSAFCEHSSQNPQLAHPDVIIGEVQ